MVCVHLPSDPRAANTRMHPCDELGRDQTQELFECQMRVYSTMRRLLCLVLLSRTETRLCWKFISRLGHGSGLRIDLVDSWRAGEPSASSPVAETIGMPSPVWSEHVLSPLLCFHLSTCRIEQSTPTHICMGSEWCTSCSTILSVNSPHQQLTRACSHAVV